VLSSRFARYATPSGVGGSGNPASKLWQSQVPPMES
jgi:hypothetical protein